MRTRVLQVNVLGTNGTIPGTVGLALKENQKFKKKEAELKELVKVSSLEESDIPKVLTIQNWIARYAVQHKQKMF
ncbi:22793_t:CDS:2 [Gigaspora margarita]|uniref:22793_t:CDS:1 n=1 Tax=Gigaspora margarita TaxID=4874 RepID=A0ABM8W0D7_GIGMA|nr:22793_t:CDS:2 [Gigaspora margarita]